MDAYAIAALWPTQSVQPTVNPAPSMRSSLFRWLIGASSTLTLRHPREIRRALRIHGCARTGSIENVSHLQPPDEAAVWERVAHTPRIRERGCADAALPARPPADRSTETPRRTGFLIPIDGMRSQVRLRLPEFQDKEDCAR